MAVAIFAVPETDKLVNPSDPVVSVPAIIFAVAIFATFAKDKFAVPDDIFAVVMFAVPIVVPVSVNPDNTFILVQFTI